MKFLLNRFAYNDEYTIGKLYVVADDFRGRPGRKLPFLCNTMEPRSAHVSKKDPGQEILALKQEGVIAIPTGCYEVRMERSRNYRRLMPFLINVKCFTGVMIHPGNYPRDTRGCILPGWNRRKGMVCGSRSAMSKIMDLISSALWNGEKIWIEVIEM